MKYLILILLLISCSGPRLRQETVTITKGEYTGCIGLIKDVEIEEQFMKVTVRCPTSQFETRTTITVPLEYTTLRTMKDDYTGK